MNPRSHKRNKSTQHWTDRKNAERREPRFGTIKDAGGALAKARADARRKEKEKLEKTSLKDLIK